MHNIGTSRRDAIKGLLAISASGALAACSGAKEGSAGSAKSTKTASELSGANMVTLTAVVDTIIPATETGGAIAAGVPATLASLVKDWGDDNFKAYWTTGMDGLGKTLNAKAGQSFANMSAKQKESLLSKYDADVYGGKIKDDFYRDMKQTAATAYYMSEIGASEELAYEPVPGEWIGCVPLADFPKTWAT
jgi:hypothetical protein